MRPPTLFSYDLVEELSKFSAFTGPYTRPYWQLIARIHAGDSSDPCVEDFRHFVLIFTTYVFGGYGPCSGLTKICSRITERVRQDLKEEKKQQFENWMFRLSYLSWRLQELGVPPLEPLRKTINIIRRVGLHVDKAEEEISSEITMQAKKWEASASNITDLIRTNIANNDRLLVVGHSHCVVRALALLRKEGTQFTMFFHCPSPADPQDPVQSTCSNCPMSALGSPIGRKEAMKLVQGGGIEKVLCGCCAYTADRKMAWVTAGAKKIVEEAIPANAKIFPVGGSHKRLEQITEDYQGTMPHSTFVDPLSAAATPFTTTFLE